MTPPRADGVFLLAGPIANLTGALPQIPIASARRPALRYAYEPYGATTYCL